MSRFGNSQGVSKTHRSMCEATGETSSSQIPLLWLLYVIESQDEGFDRFDYSQQGWDEVEQPKRLFSHWRYTVPDSNKKPKIVIDDAVLVDLFERLAGDERPQRIAFRYILALVLLRKRKLKLVGREQQENGEIWNASVQGNRWRLARSSKSRNRRR